MEKIKFDRRNYRRHSDSNKQMIRQSLEECGAGRSVLIDNTGELIAGNGVYEQAQKLGLPVRVVESDGSELVVVKRTDLAPADAKRKKLALVDNAIADHVEWNVEQIEVDFSVPEIKALGIEIPTVMTEDDEIARKEAEFRERMAAGEISEEDEEYQEFLDKFKLKKTTDDCYTPEVVYEAVADYVARTYNVSRAKFVRPFYPNGDYQKEKYPRGCVVVDNPPFSILSEILKFYKAKNIAFFLFAPTLTLFSSASSSAACALPCGVAITYANGANVNTSFLTSFEAGEVRLKSCPELYAAVKAANDKHLAEMHRELPKYVYPLELVTSTKVAAYSRLGVEFSVPVDESEPVSKLDAQIDKAIYGKGYFISRRVLAERERAERERAERFELSEREKEIINRLTK